MKFGNWYTTGVLAVGFGVGAMTGASAVAPYLLAIGIALRAVAFVASIVVAIRDARRGPEESTQTLAVDAPQFRRVLAGPVRIRVVTTTMRDVESKP